MKYMLLICDEDRDAWETMPKVELEKAYARIGRWWGEQAQKGVVVDGHELQGPRTATTVRFKNGKPVVTDGPFIEAKEAIGGYAVLDVPDLDAAIALAKSWPGEGAILEIRPIVEREQ